MRPAFKRRGHIVLALLAVLIVVGIVPLAIMSWGLIQSNRETLSRQQLEIQLLLASSVAQAMELQVEGSSAQMVRVAQTLGAAVRRRGDVPRAGDRDALPWQLIDERMFYVRYTYLKGEQTKSVSAGDHPEYLEPLFRASLGRAAEVHVREASDDNPGWVGPILSDPFLLEEGDKHAVMVVAAPVVSRGSFRGVLTGLLDLQTIWDGILRPHRTGHVVYALDDHGNVFASSDPDRVRPGRDLSDSELVQRWAATRARMAMPFKVIQHGQEQRYIGAFEMTEQGWGIFAHAPDHKIYWSVRDMERTSLSWLVALLGVAILAASFLARSLSNPINKLAAASRALAEGDFSARVEVRSRNEIGELAHTFNTMAEDIESHIQRLKRAVEENNELFLGTIRAMAQAIDAKDPYTRGHSERVNRYSVILARQLSLPEAEIRDIHVSSLLHDIGKIGIDDAILRKKGALTDEEFEIIKTHPDKGAEILGPIRQMRNIIPGLKYHHESCDGRGYPEGLLRDEIPQMARIIAVADTFDAITTNRPYQRRMTFDEAVARVNELKGVRLDAPIVEAFNRACHAGLIRRKENGEQENDTVTGASAEPAPIAAPVRRQPVSVG